MIKREEVVRKYRMLVSDYEFSAIPQVLVIEQHNLRLTTFLVVQSNSSDLDQHG